MKFTRFEDIIAWQKSKDLNILIYKTFRDCKDYSFKDQIQRAAVSIMNNIAEGYERNGNKEFRNFLYISKGSCAEVRSMAYLGLDLGYLTKTQFDIVYESTIEIGRMLSSLIKTL